MPRDYEQTAAVLVAEAEKAIVAAVEPLLKRIEALESRQLEKGEPGAPGVGVTDAFFDSEGMFVLTLSDGTARKLAVAVEEPPQEPLEPLLERIAALEARPTPERGETGADGPPGRDGLSVKTMLVDRDGHLRCVMADGTDHDLGEVVGKDGADGSAGEKGDKGDPGRDGIDGKDGRDGIDGKDGAPGTDGLPGKDAYHGQALGLYDPGMAYRELDVVSLNGSEWRAKRDDPGPLPGDGWMLSAQKGKRGEQGVAGARGPEGKPGKDAAEIIQMTLDSTTMKLIVVFSDGNSQEADFEPFARQIQEALSS